MEIKEARPENLDSIMNIYDCATVYMTNTGNPSQWNGRYPTRELLEMNIEKKQCYIYVL